MKPGNPGISVLAVACLLFLVTCDDFLDESYENSLLDTEACELLQDTIYVTIHTKKITSYDSSWLGSNVYDNVVTILDSLESEGIQRTVQDSCYHIKTPSSADTSYLLFHNSIGMDIAFFFDDIIVLNPISEAGDAVEPSSIATPLSAVAASAHYVVDETGKSTLNYCIRTRLVYHLEAGRYLLQFIRTDLTKSENFRGVFRHAT